MSLNSYVSKTKQNKKTSRDRKKLPGVHFIGCQCVKLFLPKYFLKFCHKLIVRLWVFKICQNLSFWVLSQFDLEFSYNLSFWFYHNLNFLVLLLFEFWVCCYLIFWFLLLFELSQLSFEFGHNLTFCVVSQFKFLCFVTIQVFEFCQNLSF